MQNEFKNTEIYNNQGDLLGIDENHDAILGCLKTMKPLKRKQAINQLTAAKVPSKGSRKEFEKHFRELPSHIKQGLKNGDLRMADTVIYSMKMVNSKTIKLFETQDDKEIGLRNISNAKLPKNQAFLVSGIYLLVGDAAEDSKDAMMSTRFDVIDKSPAITSGEFSLKANKKIIVPETSNRLFETRNFHGVPAGYYKLHNPRLIEDDVLVEFTVELGSMTGLPKNPVIYVGLHGTITTP